MTHDLCFDCMTSRSQILNIILINSLLQRDNSILCPVRNAKTRHIDGCLGIQSARQQTNCQLQMSLRLHISTHIRNRSIQFIGVGMRDHPRNYRVIRSFHGPNCIGMVSLQCESKSTILQTEATTLRNNSSTKTHVVGVHKRNCIALTIDNLKTDGATGSIGHPLYRCLFGVKQLFGPRADADWIDEPCWVDCHGVEICHMSTGIGKAQAHHFHQDMI
mmetsp:Transcript_25531/g.59310  ORF Transcript_25531/g.59310 Transcript_25531/m.59310 type:complete len:218 (-) Transcript_25531:500-1153(-)